MLKRKGLIYELLWNNKNVIEEKEINDKVRYIESNKETIKTYFEIGRLLVEAQGGEKRAKYGDGLIKKWSKEFARTMEKIMIILIWLRWGNFI